MSSDLALISTEALVAELYARYDCVVFAGLRDLCRQNQETDCGFAGGAVVARGLVEDLKDYIKAAKDKGILDERPDLGDWDEDEI